MSYTIPDIAKLSLLATLLCAALYTDLRNGKIYNKLTFPCMACGVILCLLSNGMQGLLQSLGGMALALVLFLVAAPAAGIGGGDTKLMMAVGAVMGFGFTIWAILLTAIVGGVLSLVVMTRHKALMSTTRQMASNVYTRFLLRAPVTLTDGSSKIKFRYSPAIALGTILAFVFINLGIV